MRLLLLIFLLGFWLSPNVWGQTRKELEKKRQSVSRAMHQTTQQLRTTQRNKKNALYKLKALRDSIAAKTALIDSMTRYTGTLDSLQERQQRVAQALQQDLKELAQRHQQLVRYYYKQLVHQPAPTTTLLQLRHKHYSRHALTKRQYQIGLVACVQQDLGQQALALATQKAEKDSLLAQAQILQEQLSEEQAQKSRKMNQLKRQERQLRQRLAQQKKSKRLLSKKIEQAILEQIAAAKAEARRYQQKKQQGRTAPSLKAPSKINKETRAFAQQKGQLLWPIYQGKIVGYYGQYAHPLFKDVLLNNNGIDLQGQYNSVVRNVYAGTVVSVFTIPGYHNAVMVKHGDYYTTYSNIAKVYVKKGQILQTGGQIGTIGRAPKGKGHLLHFELWHNKTKENPMHWIKSNNGRL
jgi:septal ring factor EnvC (AmiA/AmiB activator)